MHPPDSADLGSRIFSGLDPAMAQDVMEGTDTEALPKESRPRTFTVLVQIAVAAVIFSYVAAFAVPSALAKAEVIKRWPAGSDPRSRWFVIAFIIIMGIFMCFGAVVRFASRRQLRSIDAMEQADTPESDLNNPFTRFAAITNAQAMKETAESPARDSGSNPDTARPA